MPSCVWDGASAQRVSGFRPRAAAPRQDRQPPRVSNKCRSAKRPRRSIRKRVVRRAHDKYTGRRRHDICILVRVTLRLQFKTASMEEISMTLFPVRKDTNCQVARAKWTGLQVGMHSQPSHNLTRTLVPYHHHAGLVPLNPPAAPGRRRSTRQACADLINQRHGQWPPGRPHPRPSLTVSRQMSTSGRRDAARAAPPWRHRRDGEDRHHPLHLTVCSSACSSLPPVVRAF